MRIILHIRRVFALLSIIIIYQPQILLSNTTGISLQDTIFSPKWTKTYPAVTKGLTSVYFKVRLNQQSTVYYTFYDLPVQNITAQKIKDDATALQNSNAFKSGTIDYAGASITGSLLVNGFEADKTYYFYLVAETEGKLMEDAEIKNYTIFFHLKHNVIPYGSSDSPLGYLEYIPKDYSSNKDSLFPLILFLHGAGGTGIGDYSSLTSNTGLLREGIIRYLELEFDLPAVVLSPQSQSWSAKTINSFVEFAKQNYHIDTSRIYITGISLGGGGTWSYISAYPEKVAAAIPLCGANSPSNYPNLVNIPIWAFHNDKDPTVPLSTTVNAITNIIKVGGNPYLSVFESDDHSVAYDAYHFPGLWEWLFSQKKTAGITNAGIANVLRTSYAPIIDGNLNDPCWKGSQNNIDILKTLNTADTASFKLLWNDDYLYVGIKLINAEINSKVSIYLNGNNNPDTLYDVFDKVITFNYSGNSIEGIGNISGIEHAWFKNLDTVSLEISIPFKNNFCPNPFAGSGFGFDISVSKSVGDEQYFWNGNMQDSCNTSYLGHILLSLKSPEGELVDGLEKGAFDDENALFHCFPNPFSDMLHIEFNMQKRESCVVKILDYTGNEVAILKNETMHPGNYSLNYCGSDLKPGIYIVYLSTTDGVFCQKIVKQ